MKKNRLSSQKWYNNAVAILIGVVGYVALTHLSTIGEFLNRIGGYVTPIVLGSVIAYLVNPLASALERKIFKGIKNDTLRWSLSVFLGMAIVALVLLCLLLMLIPQLVQSMMLLVGNMDLYIARLNRLIDGMSLGTLDIGSQLEEMMGSSEDLLMTASQFLSSSLRSILSASADIGKTIFNLLIASILSIYFLMARDSIKQGSRRLLRALLSQKWYDIVLNFTARCNYILVRYIVFSLLDGVIVGGATAVFMAITGMQYVGLIAVVCGVTNLIPSFGPIIGAVIGGFILLLVNPWHALMFLIFTAVLQTLDGYVIKPKLFGDSLGVSGLLILISIVVFGNIFGIVGIFLAIPLAAIIDFTYEEGILPLLEVRRANLDTLEVSESGEEKEGRTGKQKKQTRTAMNVLTEMSEGGKRR